MRLSAALIVLLAVAGPASAVTFNEDDDGDLELSDSDLLGPSNFILDIGTNTIMGTATSAASALGTGDIDEFTFNLPERTQLTGIDVAFTDDARTGVLTASVSVLLFSIVGPIDDLEVVEIVQTSVDVTATPLSVAPVVISVPQSALPLAPLPTGQYLLSPGSSGTVLQNDIGEFVFDYTVTLEVAQVPVPAPALLLLSGLGALALVRRPQRLGNSASATA